MNIYETCPVWENEKFIIRLFQSEDCDDLLKVYSDKNGRGHRLLENVI